MLDIRQINAAHVSPEVKKLFRKLLEQDSGLPGQLYGPGTVAHATVSAKEIGTGAFRKTILTLNATPITLTDAAGSAQWGGSPKLYDFPEGVLLTHAAMLTGNLTLGVTGTFIDEFTGVTALGTATATVTTPATLTTTEADILQSTAIGTAAAKVSAVDVVSTATALTETGGRVFDGTAGAKDLYLNFSIADDATHTSGTGVFTGSIILLWSLLGDN